MAEQPIIPPLRKPVSTFVTPSHAVAFYTELVNRDDPAYKANAPVKRGTIYSTMVGAKQEVIDQYPLLYFCRERQFQQNDQLVFWEWSTDELAHDTYNAEAGYALESIHHPSFTRVYTILRDEYERQPAFALGLPLTGCIGVNILDGGINYTSATGTIDGTDVAIDFVVLDGVIISGIVTNEGTGVTGESVITITGDGANAIITPIVQSASCVLVAQKKTELPEEDPFQHEFVQVTRVYMSLPGPTIYTTRIDDDGSVVSIATTVKVATQIVSEETLLAGTWNKTTLKQSDNVYLGQEIVETRDIPGNTIESTRIDQDGIVVTIGKTLSDSTTITDGETLVGNEWTKITSEPVSDLVSNKVVETRVVPGNPIPSTRLDKDGVEVDIVRTVKESALIVTGEVLNAGVWTKTTVDFFSLQLGGPQQSDLVSWEVVEARAIPGVPVPSADIGADHETAFIESTLKEAATITPDATEAGGIITTTEQKEVSEIISEEILTRKEFLDEAFYSVAIPNVIPELFRAFIPIRVESHILAGTAAPPVLGAGEFERSERQVTKLLFERRATVLSSVSIPFTFCGFENTDENKQVVTTCYTLQDDSTPGIPPDDVTDTELIILGNGMSIQVTRTVPRVFPEDSYTISVLNLIPEKLRAAIPIYETVIDESGQPSTNPALLLGELSRTESRLTEFTRRIRVQSLGPIVVPVSVTNYETNEDKQLVTIVYTLELLGTSAASITAVQDVAIDDLGNGYEVQTLRIIPEVFTDGSYSTSILNLIPPELRATVPQFESDETSEGIASTNPTLLTGELSRTESQVNEFTKRVRITSLGAITVPVSITALETNNDKQIVNIVYTLEDVGTNVVVPTALIDVSVKDLGNDYEVVTTRTIASVFIRGSYTKSILNLIPEKLRAAVAITESSEDFPGSASTNPTLLAGELSRTEQDLTEFTYRVQIRSLGAISVPVVLIDYETNDDKQIVTVVYTLDTAGSSTAVPTATQDVVINDLGNGYEVSITRVVPNVFPNDSYTISILNLIPEKLRAAIPITEQTIDEPGQPDTTPALLTGELSRTEGRLTEYTRRIRIQSLGTIVTPVVVVDKGITREFGGGTTTVTSTLNTQGSMSVDTGLLVLKSEVIRLGNGYEVKQTELRDGAAWPQLDGQDYDERLDVIIPYDEQVTVAGTNIGAVKTDIRPLDMWRQQERTIDSTAAAAVLDAYVLSYASKINVDMPDKLISVAAVIQTVAGEGTTSETGSVAFTGAYSIRQELSAAAQSSVTIGPDATFEIKQFWGNNIDSTHYHFFLPNPVTSADVLTKINDLLSPDTVEAWPKFNPEIVNLTAVGERKSLQVTAKSQGSEALSGTGSSSTAAGGIGYSREVTLNIKSIRISPTIHDEILVSGSTSTSQGISATAFAEAVGLGPAENSFQSDTATGSISPTTIPATIGAVDWPTTGLFLYRVDAQPYRYGYVQFHVVVVDAADFPINI